jgi:hypothetical protein
VALPLASCCENDVRSVLLERLCCAERRRHAHATSHPLRAIRVTTRPGCRQCETSDRELRTGSLSLSAARAWSKPDLLVPVGRRRAGSSTSNNPGGHFTGCCPAGGPNEPGQPGPWGGRGLAGLHLPGLSCSLDLHPEAPSGRGPSRGRRSSHAQLLVSTNQPGNQSNLRSTVAAGALVNYGGSDNSGLPSQLR